MRQFLGPVWQEARRRRVRLDVIACGSRDAAYAAFQLASRKHPGAFNILLVDSDGPVRTSASAHLSAAHRWDLTAADENQIHLMVQTMEAWLIADPEALAEFYKHGYVGSSLPATRNVEEISKDDLVPALKRATRDASKGEYHKTRHAFDLLARIDPEKVRGRAPHCDRLFDTIHRYLAS
jgi:hypothetical protein